MSYSLEPLQDDCYEGTTVLINKFGIRDGKKLDIIERDITSALIAKRLRRRGLKSVVFEFSVICLGFNLHKYHLKRQYELKAA